MSIIYAFQNAFERKIEKQWDKIYVLVDIHDTIFKACYEQTECYVYFPNAKEALQVLTRRHDTCLILWSSCYPEKLDTYLEKFEHDGIHFDYVNRTKVATIEYDPNRSARIALLHYADGEKRYILHPKGLHVIGKRY